MTIDTNATRSSSMNNETRREVVNAIITIKQRKVFIDINDEDGWDVETPWGWRVAGNVGELCKIARQVHSHDREVSYR